MTIRLASVTARAKTKEHGSAALTNVSFEHDRGVLAIVGTPADGVALLLDVIDGTRAPRAGGVSIAGARPLSARRRIARVSLEAPLPEALRVEELFELAADLRAEARRPAAEVLGALAAGALAGRLVGTLSVEERRVVALALALGSDCDVILVEEPLAMMAPVAPRLVVSALRARAESSSVVVVTASVRDAVDVADRLAILSGGVYSPLPAEIVYAGADSTRPASVRVVVSSAASASGVAALVEALSQDEAIARVDTSIIAGRPGAAAIVASGADLTRVSKAITRAIGAAAVDVELVEPEIAPALAVRAALAAASGQGPRTAHHDPAPATSFEGVDHSALQRGGARDAGRDGWRTRLRAAVRAPLARVVRTRRGWGAVAGWSAFALVSAVAARSTHTSGADHVLRGSFGLIVVPLLAYGIVSAVLGGVGLRSSIRGLATLGAGSRRAASASALLAVAGSGIVAGVLAAALSAVAHGPGDAPLSADVPASFGVALLGGAAYGAYFSAGSAIGRTGAMRSLFLVADWTLGSAVGLAAVFTPRGHLASLLGGPLCFDLPRRVSSVALVFMVVAYVALAGWLCGASARSSAPRVKP